MFGRKVIKVSTTSAKTLEGMKHGNQLDGKALEDTINYLHRWIATHRNNRADRERLVSQQRVLNDLQKVWDALERGQRITYTNY